MTYQFNLVDEPWLPCVRTDGTPVELGLYDALAQAHTLRELQGETPLGTAALHRLLLAILHRNFGPESQRAWSKLWRARRWDAGVLRSYFDRWRHRFDLFDPEHPFYQCSDPPGEPEPMNRVSLPHGYNSTLFEHQMADGSLAVSPARAARWLVTLHAYSIGTGPPRNPYPAGALTNTILIMPLGHSLFETLAFNLIRYDETQPFPAPWDREDRPIWEYDESPFPPDPKRFYLPGYLEYLTWQTRTVLLLPSTDGDHTRITQCYLSQGARWDSSEVKDPMKIYIQAKRADVGMLPLRFREDRAMWRDSAALFRFGDDASRPPLSFSWLARHVGEGDLDRSQVYDYAALGLSNDKARLDFFRHERMPLPLVYVSNEELSEQLRSALHLAEEVGNSLRVAGRLLAAWIVSPADSRAAHRDGIRLVFSRLRLEERYWSGLEVPFQQFIRELPSGTERAMQAWISVVQSAARTAFREAANAATEPTRALKAHTLARDRLEGLMARLLKPAQVRTSEADTIRRYE